MKKFIILSLLVLIPIIGTSSPKKIYRPEDNPSKKVEHRVFFALEDKYAVETAQKIIKNEILIYNLNGVQPIHVKVVKEAQHRYRITFFL